MFLSVLSVALLAQLTGCASPPQPANSTSSAASTSEWIGCWYGEDFQPVMGQSSSWLMNRKSNGTFEIEFWSWAPTGKLNRQTEAGRWTSTKENYTTVTTAIDGNLLQKSYADSYEIRSFNGNEVVYFHSQAKLTFKSRKVDCDYVPPSPRNLNGPA